MEGLLPFITPGSVNPVRATGTRRHQVKSSGERLVTCYSTGATLTVVPSRYSDSLSPPEAQSISR